MVDDARWEHRDPHPRCCWVGLGDLAGPVVKRVVRDGGEALLLCERSEGQTDIAVSAQRVLEGGEPAGEAVDAIRGRPLSQEEALCPGHPGPLDRLGADVGDERGERDADRADRVAGVAAHAKRLLVGHAVDAVVPG